MADAVVDKGPLVLGVVISTLAVGGLFIAARVFTRTVIRPNFGFDDVLIVLTWFLILGYNIAVFVSVHRGYGRHKGDLTDEQYVSAVHAEVAGQVLAIASFPSGKASIAYLLTRLFPGKLLRWILWTFVAANTVFFYIDSILVIAQCQPVAFQWDHAIEGGTCWDPKVVIDWGYLTGVTGAVTDFTFAILPWFYITKVKIGFKEKLSVGVALSAGFFASICSILKIYYTTTLGAHSDYSYDTVPLVIWSCVELALINVAACIPTLRPLYLWFSGKGDSNPTTNNSAYAQYGNASGRLGRLAHRSGRGTELISAEDVHELNIYHTKTCDVTFNDRDDEQAKTPGTASSLGASVEVRHGV